MYGTNMISF